MTIIAKRERQARRLLRVCLRPLEDGCLEAYIRGFERRTLRRGTQQLCALGHMGVGCKGEGTAFYRMSNGPHPRESDHIENIFEGWWMFNGSELIEWSMARFQYDLRWRNYATDQTRWQWIYDACVEELARRAVDHVPMEALR